MESLTWAVSSTQSISPPVLTQVFLPNPVSQDPPHDPQLTFQSSGYFADFAALSPRTLGHIGLTRRSTEASGTRIILLSLEGGT